jgi:hypothetical protein
LQSRFSNGFRRVFSNQPGEGSSVCSGDFPTGRTKTGIFQTRGVSNKFWLHRV